MRTRLRVLAYNSQLRGSSNGDFENGWKLDCLKLKPCRGSKSYRMAGSWNGTLRGKRRVTRRSENKYQSRVAFSHGKTMPRINRVLRRREGPAFDSACTKYQVLMWGVALIQDGPGFQNAVEERQCWLEHRDELLKASVPGERP